MPPGMGNLTELRMLSKFVLGTRKQSSSSSIRELRNLDHLRGELSIENLQHVENPIEASAACLERKKHLKQLGFKWAAEVESEIAYGVLKSLKPHENLERLSIVGYGGTEFPNWIDVGYSSVSNLVSLKLNGRKNCSCLPSLGELPSLRDLSITAFEKVRNVDLQFYARPKTSVPFKSMEILRFERMPQWESWSDVDGAFPLLQELYIKDCPELTKSLPSRLPSLTTMGIKGCHKLVVSLPSAATLWKVRLNKVMLDKLSSGLYRLQVEEYSQVPVKQMEVLSTALEEIHISNDSSLIYLPVESFPNLKKLNVRQCSRLKSFFPAEVASTSYSAIRDPSNLISYPDPKFPPIQHAYIIDCPELCVASLLALPTIQSIKLFSWGRSQMELSKLPSKLCSLQVQHFHLFEEIQGQSLTGAFTNLEAIEITGCCRLENFWLEFFPKLKSLKIYHCFNLESLCTPETISSENKEKSDSLPEVCSNFPLLQELCIYGCKKLHLLSLPRPLTIHTMSLQDNSRDVRLCKQSSGLYSLHIRRFYSLEEIETWLLSGGFPNSAAEITIEVCDQLKYFQLGKFPKLQGLEIGHCPNFQSLEITDEEFTSLNSLSIHHCPNFASFQRGGLRAPNLTFLSLLDCSRLNSLSDDIHTFLPSLLNLIIAGCPQFESCPEGGFPSTLSLLTIKDLQILKSVRFNELTHLRELSIQHFPNLQSMPECMLALLPSLVTLTICDCPQLESFFTRNLPFKLESLAIRNCNKLLACLMLCDMHTLPSFTQLTIAGNSDLASLPEETLLPSSLSYL
ncbi:conserved hypothetical protein [Ricinus communis]|uniref:R13L1/DRL21-like LRR repeat region domain-containing protein n=1 Tax=Ricinus communis TaxID=3988 RepID=B9RV82_RICCO|nr:conserved hypothetical protein [Ricinus communis]